MYVAIYKIDDQCKFDARSRVPKAGALGYPRGMWWGRKWEGDSGGVCVGGLHVYLWPIHANAWQNHHKIIK